MVCGGGPAGLGPLVAATKRGELDALLDTGVLVVELGERLGPGTIGRYRVRGNSLARAFLECLERSADGGLLDSVRAAPETCALERIRDEEPPLGLVANFLSRMAGALEDALDTSAHSGAELRTRATRVRILPREGALVTLEPEAGPGPYTVSARRVVLALGGCPPRRMLDVEVVPGVPLRAHADRVVHSSQIVERDDAAIERLAALGRAPSVVVVGGGHSAWSVAWVLLREPSVCGRLGGEARVQILHRSPVRLYYQSPAHASADGYRFDPAADVCPLSGRVNRFSGLRGDALTLARQAFGFDRADEPPSRVRCVSLRTARPEAVVAALDTADLIVSAVGYDARLPELQTADGAALELAASQVGCRVSGRGEVLDAAGQPMPALLAYGLGAGLAPSPAVGGEPSSSTAADGVWLYHHDVGNVVLDRLLDHEREPVARVR